jgi:hypothetical protein
VAQSFDKDILNALHEALQHIEWLTQHAKTSESGNALGVVTNAKAFLARPDIHNMRVLRAQAELTQRLAEERRKPV